MKLKIIIIFILFAAFLSCSNKPQLNTRLITDRQKIRNILCQYFSNKGEYLTLNFIVEEQGQFFQAGTDAEGMTLRIDLIFDQQYYVNNSQTKMKNYNALQFNDEISTDDNAIISIEKTGQQIIINYVKVFHLDNNSAPYDKFIEKLVIKEYRTGIWQINIKNKTVLITTRDKAEKMEKSKTEWSLY